MTVLLLDDPTLAWLGFRRFPWVGAVAIQANIAARRRRTAEANLIPGLGVRIIERGYIDENSPLKEILGVDIRPSRP